MTSRMVTKAFILATDSISECVRFKSLKNLEMKREKATPEVKSEEYFKRNRSNFAHKIHTFTIMALNIVRGQLNTVTLCGYRRRCKM